MGCNCMVHLSKHQPHSCQNKKRRSRIQSCITTGGTQCQPSWTHRDIVVPAQLLLKPGAERAHGLVHADHVAHDAGAQVGGQVLLGQERSGDALKGLGKHAEGCRGDSGGALPMCRQALQQQAAAPDRRVVHPIPFRSPRTCSGHGSNQSMTVLLTKPGKFLQVWRSNAVS